MGLKKLQLIFKTNDLILFVYSYNNKTYKQKSSDISYRIRINFLVRLHIYSIKKLLLISFIKYTALTLFHGFQINTLLAKIILAFNITDYFSIKLNNKFYPLFMIKSTYFFNYYSVQKLLYQSLSNIIRKIFKII